MNKSICLSVCLSDHVGNQNAGFLMTWLKWRLNDIQTMISTRFILVYTIFSLSLTVLFKYFRINIELINKEFLIFSRQAVQTQTATEVEQEDMLKKRKLL